ncbi:MAG: flagellar basal body-associated FliL family protein [Gammaproteobacteria bacterium]|nr:flagellar basal body-associated FliL family protein [Gammaproteobacteria bacterium]
MAETLELSEETAGSKTARWWWVGLLVAAMIALSVVGALYGFGIIGGDVAGDKDAPRQEAIYVSVEPPFTVNFSGDGNARYLQVGMDIMTRDPDVREQLERHMPVIRNDLVLLLSSKTAEDLGTLEGKEELQQETLSAVRRVIEDETDLTGVEAVYFTSFVMQ